jgi:N-acetylglucosaminyldiphosphoundecaprenol N-acetyl-beta-D-mannosaminyltransferase
MRYAAPTGKRRPFGLDWCSQTSGELVDDLLQPLPRQPEVARLVATANLDHIVRLQSDTEFRAAYDSAWRVTADGMPVFLYARWRGAGVSERVTGADVFAALMRRLSPGVHRPFFVLASETVAQEVSSFLAKERGFVPGAIGYLVPEFGFEKDTALSEAMAEAIRAHGATHLFFCVGAPKSEKWLHRYRCELGACYALPFGAAAEFFIGSKARAPSMVRRSGFEWLWRLAQEPHRLWRRYLVDSWRALGAVMKDLEQERAANRRIRPAGRSGAEIKPLS